MAYSESDLIVPTLVLLLANKDVGLNTSQLIDALMSELDLSLEDLRILKDRNDTHFSQKVRNLISHDTLEKKGLATYEKFGRVGTLKITPLGERYILENATNYDFVMNNGFDEAQRENVIKRDFDNLVIEEGFTQFVSIQKRKRSRALVKLAKEHYAINGKLYCSICKFNFEDFYGELGKDFIEIHHLEPIFAYEDAIEKSLEEALQNVRPVCSNCHRMIHRNTKSILSIEQVRALVIQHGQFDILDD